MINEALKLVRLYWGYTQADLARKVDVSQSLISEVEKGQKAVTMDLLERYSAGLDIRMSQLLFFAEEIEGSPVERRGKLIFAGSALKLLEKLKPNEPTPA
jgi:transcriptional regulator with XRE-family HTH domain